MVLTEICECRLVSMYAEPGRALCSVHLLCQLSEGTASGLGDMKKVDGSVQLRDSSGHRTILSAVHQSRRILRNEPKHTFVGSEIRIRNKFGSKMNQSLVQCGNKKGWTNQENRSRTETVEKNIRKINGRFVRGWV